MSLKKIGLIIMCFGMLGTSCSLLRDDESSSAEEMVDVQADEDETLDMLDDFEGEDLFALDEQALDDDLMETEDENLVFSDDEEMNDMSDMDSSEDWQQASTTDSAPVISEPQDYTVQEGDTLMYISYKMYGDYSQWRSIASLNGISNGQENLSVGTVLELDPAKVNVRSEVPGPIYIIKRGDSLSKISMNQYGTFDQWKALWEHNSVMIKDPDLIFAGFQMHLLPDGTMAYNF